MVSESFLGVLMLDTRFPRAIGDVGNPKSFAMPVRHRVVAGASPQRVVGEGDPALLQPFIDAARQLVDDGARAITTSCGFLVLFQQALQTALPVPVWTSSLLKLPELQAPGPGGADRRLRQRLHLHEPLLADERLDHALGAVRDGHVVLVVLDEGRRQVDQGDNRCFGRRHAR